VFTRYTAPETLQDDAAATDADAATAADAKRKEAEGEEGEEDEEGETTKYADENNGVGGDEGEDEFLVNWRVITQL
jgi:hypothetical protein